MHVAVIASMKRGLEHFVYRELLAFSAQGFTISLLPTRLQTGLYSARPEWVLHRWHLLVVLLLQPYYFVKQPLRYLTLLVEGLRTGALVDVALAWNFAPRIADADLIYATFGDHKLFIGYFCKQILGKPLVVTIHAYELYQNPNPRLFERALAACDRVITVTEHNRELLAGRFGVAPSKLEVVRIGVDLDEYRPERKFVVMIAAFFAERKGHEILFKALRQLGRDDVEVWVVGDEGTEQSVDVRGMAKALGVEGQVAFFGRLGGNSLKALYRACDVFCLPCRQDSDGVSEGFPAAIVEAMAFGKPVISTRHVEIPRVLDQILVPENDVDALAEALERVYQDAALRERLGEQNRRLAERTFSSRNVEQTTRIFRALAGLEQSAPSAHEFDVSPGAGQRPAVAVAVGATPRAQAATRE